MDGFDIIVIGGGPGGSTSATYLARAGHKVLLLEKEKFPRFHVGESLLPYNQTIFAELGVLPRLQEAGCIVKHGAQFHLANGSKANHLCFRNGCFTRHTEAFQVERSKFDHLLLQHSRDQGADVREGWSVRRFASDASGVSVTAEDPQGVATTFHGKFLIDASGRGNVTGNQEGLREIHPRLKKLAVFGHFAGVQLDAGPKGGDTVIVRLENKWFWIIPLSAEKTSVGCVLDRDEFSATDGSPAEIFTRIWQSSAVLRERLRDARLLGEMHVTSDFSYRNRRLTGPRLLRVGDAAGFMDPIFSAGVYLAMYSGRLAARLVAEALRKGTDGARAMPGYERKLRKSMGLYWELVEGYYTRPFMDLLMNPNPRLDLPSAVTALLAGELDGGWRIRWRMRLFFLLVKLQGRFHLVPPVSWEPVETMEKPASSLMASCPAKMDDKVMS
jgi:flavin-dependent dehydrogenase